MNKVRVLIIGSGHLAYRVQKQVELSGYENICLSREVFALKDSNGSRFELIADVIKNIDLTAFSMVYVLDDHDAFNMELIISLISLSDKLPITASLFNENITPHLQAAHPNIRIINPAKIAARKFVESLDTPIKRFLRYAPTKRGIEKLPTHRDNLILMLIGMFSSLIALSTVYFHFAEELSWIDSLYFVVATIATVGYGDINLLNSSDVSKIIDIILILTSTLFIWLIFSLTIDGLIKKRAQLSLGRKKYYYKGHIMVCGLGKLGYFIAEELVSRGECIVIIEKDENNPHVDYFRKHGVDIYIGDARQPQVLEDVGVMNARAVMSVINNDYVNVEIGLNARSFNPDLRLILRIFDELMSEKIKENLDIHLALSTSAIADEHFVGVLKNA